MHQSKSFLPQGGWVIRLSLLFLLFIFSHIHFECSHLVLCAGVLSSVQSSTAHLVPKWAKPGGKSQVCPCEPLLSHRVCVCVCVECNSGERHFLRTSVVSLQVCHCRPLWVWLDRCLWKACGSTRNTPPSTTQSPRLLLTLYCLFFLGSSKWYSDHKMCCRKCVSETFKLTLSGWSQLHFLICRGSVAIILTYVSILLRGDPGAPPRVPLQDYGGFNLNNCQQIWISLTAVWKVSFLFSHCKNKLQVLKPLAAKWNSTRA